jgi:hypothetical protein
MWSGADATWNAAVATSHTATTLIEVLDAERSLLTTLRPHTGSVSVDRRRSIWRTTSGLALADADGTLSPTDIDDLLSPFAQNYLAPYRGIVVAGTPRLAPLGVFSISRADPTTTSEGTIIAIQATGIAGRIAGLTLEAPYTTAAADVAEAIRSLITSRWAAAPLDLDTVGFTAAPVTLDVGADPWRASQQLAAAAGYDLAEESDGFIRLRPVPNPVDLTADITYGTGGNPVLKHNRPLDLSDAYSGVTVVAENSSLAAPITVTLWDTDPTSATNVDRIGKRARPVSMPSIGSAAQAEAAAAGELRRQSGYAAEVDLAVLVNAAHDPGDGIGVELPGLSGVLALDAFTVPLTVGEAMPITVRQRPEVSQ